MQLQAIGQRNYLGLAAVKSSRPVASANEDTNGGSPKNQGVAAMRVGLNDPLNTKSIVISTTEFSVDELDNHSNATPLGEKRLNSL